MSEPNLESTLVHVDLVVADMERSVAFYKKSLGMLIVEDCTAETEAAVFLSGGTARVMRMVFLVGRSRSSMMVELIQLLDDGGQAVSVQPLNAVTLAFRVNDLGELARAMAADGQQPVSEVIELELTQLGRARVVFYRDPSGYLIEFVQFVED